MFTSYICVGYEYLWLLMNKMASPMSRSALSPRTATTSVSAFRFLFHPLHRPPEVRDHNRTPDRQCHAENIEKLRAGHPQFLTLLNVVCHAIVAAQDQRRAEAQHLLRLFIQRSRLKRQRIHSEKTLDRRMIFRPNPLIHFRAEFVELVNALAHTLSKGKNRGGFIGGYAAGVYDTNPLINATFRIRKILHKVKGVKPFQVVQERSCYSITGYYERHLDLCIQKASFKIGHFTAGNVTIRPLAYGGICMIA